MVLSPPLSLQPIPYQGSKRTLAPRICGLFNQPIGTLYEPFAGSAAVTLYAASHNLADHFVIGDIYVPLIDLWELIINKPTELSEQYSVVWHAQFDVGASHFDYVRAQYNEEKNPVLLLYLIVRCVKNAVRFNRQGNFTQSADKRRTGTQPDRVTRTVHAVSRLLKGRTTLFRGDFQDCTVHAGTTDLIYMDPPYQGTTNGKDKRYASGLARDTLIEALQNFDARNIAYVLSYDGQTGEKTYGHPLPHTIAADHLAVHAGRSSQSTLIGRDEMTIESLYVSHALTAKTARLYKPNRLQAALSA